MHHFDLPPIFWLKKETFYCGEKENEKGWVDKIKRVNVSTGYKIKKTKNKKSKKTKKRKKTEKIPIRAA